MAREEVRGEFDVSLEEVVRLLKIPPLIQEISSGRLFLEDSQKYKFPLIKKSYKDSLDRVVCSQGENAVQAFRIFIKRFDSYFGKQIFEYLDSMDRESVDYVLGSLKFENHLEKFKSRIPAYSREYLTH
jgi:hypothetical protein